MRILQLQGRGPVSAVRHALDRFRHDTSGLSGVEFALILPVMVFIYMGVVDLSLLITADRKVTNVASAVGDLVSQATQISDNDIADIFEASATIMEPMENAQLSIVVTSVVADEDNDTTVDWSEAFNGSGSNPGDAISLPEGLTEAGSSVIVATATFTYQSPVSTFVSGGPVALSETFYLRPRRTVTVTRVN